jgi:hypothetical protein
MTEICDHMTLSHLSKFWQPSDVTQVNIIGLVIFMQLFIKDVGPISWLLCYPHIFSTRTDPEIEILVSPSHL